MSCSGSSGGRPLRTGTPDRGKEFAEHAEVMEPFASSPAAAERLARAVDSYRFSTDMRCAGLPLIPSDMVESRFAKAVDLPILRGNMCSARLQPSLACPSWFLRFHSASVFGQHGATAPSIPLGIFVDCSISCMGNSGAHPQTERNHHMKWKTKEIAVVAMVAAVIGAIFTLMDFIYMPLSAALGVVFMEITFGIYMLSPLVPMYLVRKPGAAVFGALVVALVNLLLGSPYGVQLILANLLEGVAVEIGFAVISRYKGTLANFALSGILGALFVFGRDFIVFYAMAFQSFMIPLLIVRILSAVFVGWILTKLIAAALNKTGATRGFACAEKPAR